jgi:hypothetical protein
MLNTLKRFRSRAGRKLFEFIVRRLARSEGFLDPISILSKMRRFAQPSEVYEPVELLRSGAVFHARGLLNTRAIQHNLDWIWPYWVVQQFNPRSSSFIPRGFSLTHINMTHRNWTAIGLPDIPVYPVVDPRGLITPYYDGWSIEPWFIPDQSSVPPLFPSQCPSSIQNWDVEHDVLRLNAAVFRDNLRVESSAGVEYVNNSPVCMIQYRVESGIDGWLAIGLRPCNPEGISLINSIRFEMETNAWRINEAGIVSFSEIPERHMVSSYHDGDVRYMIPRGPQGKSVQCHAGLATGAALFRITGDTARTTRIQIPLDQDPEYLDQQSGIKTQVPTSWNTLLNRVPALDVPDKLYRTLYRQSILSLILHSPGDVYPGPFIYKRFWFRDAAFIGQALLAAGLSDRVLRCLKQYPGRQKRSGFFHSQDGEWDSNGEALWLMHEYGQFTGQKPLDEWIASIERGADWIIGKRQETLGDGDAIHAGLLPAGFSAEHLGLNNYYYWDDFWATAGLRSAAGMLRLSGRKNRVNLYHDEADHLLQIIRKSIAAKADDRQYSGIPASPYRRMDSGAVGSLVSVYPLNILGADSRDIRDTVNFLVEHCMVDHAFFQDNIHSGMNAYLTLHIAQVMLKNSDQRAFQLIDSVADLASPTGQWPEAIHPGTRGGCMGDGHHVWASAEWFMIIRNMFVREDSDRLVLLKGIPGRWLESNQHIRLEAAPTHHGMITVSCKVEKGKARVRYSLNDIRQPVRLSFELPGFENETVTADSDGDVTLERME